MDVCDGVRRLVLVPVVGLNNDEAPVADAGLVEQHAAEHPKPKISGSYSDVRDEPLFGRDVEEEKMVVGLGHLIATGHLVHEVSDDELDNDGTDRLTLFLEVGCS